MEKLLICSGDSFTDPIFRSAPHPEMDVSWPKWPEIMAKELGMRCINLGRSGSGNEYIYSSLQDAVLKIKDKSRIGLIVAAWSQGFRRDFQICEGENSGPFSWQSEWNDGMGMRDPFAFGGDTHYMDKENYFKEESNLLFWQEEWIKNAIDVKGWSNERVDAYGDIQGWVRRSMRYFMNLQIMCERYNIPYLQTQMIPLYIDYIRGLPPTEEEIQKGLRKRGDTRQFNGNKDKAQGEVNKIILEYDEAIDGKRFFGWPISRDLGGFTFNLAYLGECHDPDNDLQISEIDSHPSKLGHEKIAKVLLEKYHSVI